ncbi:alpha-tocopherol transfer protein-like [Leguminivora glycinivorella]|uniref:alpha-tocopherol transfer protein-like n=1 Tax=Leguminivora glycinivorella TaxID=1035111 RepID=UPI002010B3E6|nr:alpha-tocopherol transfer protein-like [Leguminivora glycinivorella]XP_047996015.1 alpha-tocopherol transfer protein-like [Leguminivora glycinivorella]XP_047996016.1 alpha-tocopherol transfer protein-like [Leguminivora glycinivorella]XP_047996017.1 alpha-tocopherol transfer protein-like [Leguminivora glycinivorella]XP_047996018.1 alpha-tocopherol transfer protein-like [Leguminivora glycinivorella]
MPFIDIAFQADVSRYEDAEFEEFSRRNCGENPGTRDAAIEELRRLIKEKGECRPRRTDDAYLLRFLRCRRFIPALAHRLMVRYEDFRSKNPELYDCDAFGLQRVKDVFSCTFPDNPDNGRITIMRLGKWDMDNTPAEDLIRCALLLDEICAMQPRLQILGVTIVIDLKGLGLRHLRYLNLKTAGQFASLLGVAFPLLLQGLHIINYNWLFNSILPMFKQFIPQAGWERIHFHSNLESLHKHIHPKYLPPEYGGHSKYLVTCEEWLSKIEKYKDDFMVQDLRDLGYQVK